MFTTEAQKYCEYPKAVYKGEESALVRSLIEEEALRSDGWNLDTIQFAPEPDEKTELIEQAEALGIDVDRRWSVVRLRREIGAKNGDNNEIPSDQVSFL